MVSAVIHQQKIRLLRYPDDWLILVSSKQEAQQATQTLIKLCQTLGIVINWEKSSLTPSQSMTFLGMEIQSLPLKVFPSLARLTNLRAHLTSFLASSHPPASEWISLLGHMASLIHIISNSRRRMRSLQSQLHKIWDPQSQQDSICIPWNSDILEDLQWWLNDYNLNAGQSLQTAPPILLLFSDASTEGWGASLLHQSVSGLWSE